MSVIGRMVRRVLKPVIEQQGRRHALEAWAPVLKATGRDVEARLQEVPDTPGNREVANHIVGIERWGQRRLRVALGEPPIRDSYRGYRLPEGTPLEELIKAFSETRQQTVELADALYAAKLAPGLTVEHNDLGPLSVRGWLAYLSLHAKREALRLKRGDSRA
jgi:hypothetical protein